jgi:hypothetical protein
MLITLIIILLIGGFIRTRIYEADNILSFLMFLFYIDLVFDLILGSICKFFEYLQNLKN